jgi:hypothetical protein
LMGCCSLGMVKVGLELLMRNASRWACHACVQLWLFASVMRRALLASTYFLLTQNFPHFLRRRM